MCIEATVGGVKDACAHVCGVYHGHVSKALGYRVSGVFHGGGIPTKALLQNFVALESGYTIISKLLLDRACTYGRTVHISEPFQHSGSQLLLLNTGEQTVG